MATAQALDWPKTWLTVQARAALAGWRAVVLEGDDGQPELIVDRWGRTHRLRTIDEAREWLVRIGAPVASQDEEARDACTTA